MASFELPDNLVHTLSLVLTQLHQSLPPVQQTPDFSALAYQWSQQQLQPITQLSRIALPELKGIDTQKQKIVQNTLQFLHGFSANNVLLTGARGTGKSSIIRALLTEYAAQGLRLIEIARDDLVDLPKIQSLIANRPERFIVYCDDLAFNAEDENYRSLKSVLDGSLQSGTGNFIIYATSNRRHLLPEFMHENNKRNEYDVPQYHELHPQEAIEEKVSLSDRFGLWLSFYSMDQTTYLNIVQHYVQQAKLNFDDATRSAALQWCHSRGQRSGRSAYQFAQHWVGKTALEQLQQQAQQQQ